MPERGNRFRSEKNRVATVLGLVFAIAMVSTIIVPMFAHARLGQPGWLDPSCQFRTFDDDVAPHGNLCDVAVHELDRPTPPGWRCKDESDDAPQDPADVPVFAGAQAQLCIVDKVQDGCKMAGTASVDIGLEAKVHHPYWLLLDFQDPDWDVAEQRALVSDVFYRSQTITESDALDTANPGQLGGNYPVVPYGQAAVVRAQIQTEVADQHVSGWFAEVLERKTCTRP